MNLEIGKDIVSVEDGVLVAFTNIEYKIVGSFLHNAWIKKRAQPRSNEQIILDNACGALRPGRLTFILGPSGAGKTSLLKILAGRKKRGVKGSIQGIGRNAVLVAQQATLIDALTVRETLQFAAVLKLPETSRLDRNDTIERISCQLGIRDVFNTRARCLSGGERKRLTIACELLSDPHIMLLDEPTSGLDSVSSMSVAKALLAVARAGRTVACVIHQPSSQLFSTGDDVLLLAYGRTLYAGSINDVPNVLKKAGFTCPQYYNMADYLIEIASCKHIDSLAILENDAKLYASELRKIAEKENTTNEKNSEISNEAESLLKVNTTNVGGYSASYGLQLRALLWRGYKGAVRDLYLTQIRLVAHILVALLLGALYKGAGEEAHRMNTNTGCLFFFLLFLFFSNAMPTVQTFPVEFTVVLQEHLNKWYSLTTYCASKILVDLPVQLLCATCFIFPAWYLTSQPLELHRIGLAWVICALTTILAQTFGLLIGAACGVKLGIFVIPAVNIPMLMFSGFFIPYDEMPYYLRPFAVISYFRYAFDAFLLTVYGFERPKLPCHKDFCFFKHPAKYLDYLGLTQNFNNDIIALIVWIIVLEISLVCVLKYRVYKACR